MRHPIGTIITQMIHYEHGEPARVHHFLKVHAFAQVIGQYEGLDELQQETLEIASILHDIGIRESLRKYGSSEGIYQEKEGPPLARKMLEQLDYDEDFINRVCYLIAHHHNWETIDGPDHQILVEADFLVNALDSTLSNDVLQKVRKELFRTEKGKAYLETMYIAA